VSGNTAPTSWARVQLLVGGYRFEQHPVGWLACLQGLDQELEELEAEETIAALQRTHGWVITERV
jgi:hypothetical protein